MRSRQAVGTIPLNRVGLRQEPRYAIPLNRPSANNRQNSLECLRSSGSVNLVPHESFVSDGIRVGEMKWCVKKETAPDTVYARGER